MAYQAVPNVASVAFLYKCDGQNIQNTYYVYRPGGYTEEELAILAEQAAAWYTSTQAPMLPETVELFSVVATDLTSLDSSRFAYVVDPPVPGTLASPMLPLSVTIAIKLGIGKRGRGRQGRIFWPVLTEGKVNLDSVDNVFVGDIETAIEGLKTTLEAALPGCQLVVVHRFKDNIRLDPATHDPVL